MDHEGAIKHILDRLRTELPEHLYYHGQHHTLDVLNAVERIADHEDVSEPERELLRVGAAYHDAGFIHGPKDHEEAGCRIARETLPRFGYDQETIELICNMIMATKIPQSPNTRLAEILCDADLDYLGRNDFEPIARSLYDELRHLGVLNDEHSWNRMQVNFLNQHTYHTSYGKQLRGPKKKEHLIDLENRIADQES